MKRCLARSLHCAAGCSLAPSANAAAVKARRNSRLACRQLVAANGVPANKAGQALVDAFTANSTVKCIGAMFGGVAYARPVIGGIVSINAGLIVADMLISY